MLKCFKNAYIHEIINAEKLKSLIRNLAVLKFNTAKEKGLLLIHGEIE